MRLINIHTLQMEEFFDKKIPKYIILSHTWGPDEITFQEWQAILELEELEKTLNLSEAQGADQALAVNSYAGQQRRKVDAIKAKDGYKKVIKFSVAVKALLKDGEDSECLSPNYRLPSYIFETPIDWIWIDTCCIDKKSSAELSEAINSMYRWYAASVLCIVYLSDVSLSHPSLSKVTGNIMYGDLKQSFLKSRWFTRGWTLQELLAPQEILFLDSEWGRIGTAQALCNWVEQATGIEWLDILSLQGRNLFRTTKACISVRMSWASKRTTTRSEDMAYCLLGIFGVNMPLLYGEGGTRAFFRLQEEIMKQSTDHTIFAWGYGMALVGDAVDGEATKSVSPEFDNLLAPSPAYFVNGHLLKPVLMEREPPFHLTNKGLQIHLRLRKVKETPETHIALLNCTTTDAHITGVFVGIPLRLIHSTANQRAIVDGDVLERFPTSKPAIVQVHDSNKDTENTVFLRRNTGNLVHFQSPQRLSLRISSLAKPQPPEPWKIHQIVTPNPQIDHIARLPPATSSLRLSLLLTHRIIALGRQGTNTVVCHFTGPTNFLRRIEIPTSFWTQVFSSGWRLFCQDLDSSEHKDTWVPIPLVQPGPLNEIIKENRTRDHTLSEWPSHELLHSLDSFEYIATQDMYSIHDTILSIFVSNSAITNKPLNFSQSLSLFARFDTDLLDGSDSSG